MPEATNETQEKAFVGPSKNTDKKEKKYKGNCKGFYAHVNAVIFFNKNDIITFVRIFSLNLQDYHLC